MNEWTKKAKRYASAASNKKSKDKYGKWIRLACKRYLEDLKRAGEKDSPFIFNEDEAANACDFISNLPHVEGTWDSVNIELADFQVFFLVNLFGFRNLDGSRRFSSVLFAVARKNAKSTLAACVGLYCLTMENENGPQSISAATTGDQARIVFNIAKRMVEKTPDLQCAFDLKAFTRAVACYSNGGLMKAINAKASTQDGLNPSCSILDEIHAHRTHDLLNVIQSAAGARKNPLFLYTTTEGYETPGPWPELRQFSKNVLQGVVEADHFLTIYYCIDEKDDEFDPKVWIKANPLLEENEILFKTIEKAAKDAKEMPGRHAEFLIKRVNRQSSTVAGWIDLHKWKTCKGKVDLDFLKDEPCYGALDLASTRDLTSFRLVWFVNNIIYTHGWRWVPETTVELRKKRNLVPYSSWVGSGDIIETPGEVTDYDTVYDKIIDVDEKFNLINISYDTWNSAQLASKLSNQDIEMVPFIQGPKSYHPPMKYFEEAYISGRFRHGGDPVLTWCASNLVPRYDQNMNMAPDKKKSADKIDDMTALLMAIRGILPLEEDDELDDFISNPITLN
ncbi:MAG: terminase large subunit [Candidatus Omnitrophica bacterium]|nr:terminase large subunit [Candidatus Omnitrophota bacterium]